MLRSALKWIFYILFWGGLILAGLVYWKWDIVKREFALGEKIYEHSPPDLPERLPSPAIMVFSKTNGMRHSGTIEFANDIFSDIAKKNRWSIFQTESGGAFTPEILDRFDTVVFNNVTGDVLTPEQRDAFQNYVESGGGFVGIHAAGGERGADWGWFTKELIGAKPIGSPYEPASQEANVFILDKSHPATKHLPDMWTIDDEWYSFAGPPPAEYHVLATVDETTYNKEVMWGKKLDMGDYHPIIWWHCQGAGRAFYSGLGHNQGAYLDPAFRTYIGEAVKWSLRKKGKACEG